MRHSNLSSFIWGAGGLRNPQIVAKKTANRQRVIWGSGLVEKARAISIDLKADNDDFLDVFITIALEKSFCKAEEISTCRVNFCRLCNLLVQALTSRILLPDIVDVMV